MHSGCRDGILHNGKFQYPPCPDNAEIIPLTESDKQDILDFHNEQRNFVACGGLYKEYGIKPGCRHGVITWDKELEKTAFLHTSYCTFAHDKCRNTLKYPFSGQNLGILTYVGKHLNATAYGNVISYLWYIEYRLTVMAMIDSYYHQTKVMVGHFLTSLNERNNRIGCTCAKFYFAEKKKEAVMLSCNYPTTNIARSTIYNSCKVPASKCTTGTDPKYKFLCSTKEEYDVKGKLALIPYDGDGSEEFNNCGRQPEMLHLEREGREEVQKQDKVFSPSKPTTTVEKPPVATTKKPEVLTTPKPGGGATTGKPVIGKPINGIDGSNPAAGGIPDYSEDEYDPPDSSFAVPCQERNFLNSLSMLVVLFNFIQLLFPLLNLRIYLYLSCHL
ncbi:tabinhibitin 2-like [Calliphora vicina]|uniref:tabinhibitin 2-like n=1 Tax=Calliphora vicina TaxID=7373 RepID=UPI00325A916A